MVVFENIKSALLGTQIAFLDFASGWWACDCVSFLCVHVSWKTAFDSYLNHLGQCWPFHFTFLRSACFFFFFFFVFFFFFLKIKCKFVSSVHQRCVTKLGVVCRWTDAGATLVGHRPPEQSSEATRLHVSRESHQDPQLTTRTRRYPATAARMCGECDDVVHVIHPGGPIKEAGFLSAMPCRPI